MIERLLELHLPIVGVLNDVTVSKLSDAALDLTPEQWYLAKELVAVLTPVSTTTTYWSGESYVTISSIHPMVAGLKETMKVNVGDSEALCAVKKEFAAQLESRFPVSPKSLAVQAAAIDPRFRKLVFLDATQREAAITYLKKQLSDTSDNASRMVEPPAAKKPCTLSALEQVLGQHDVDEQPAAQEVDSFLSEAALPLATDCLQWWQQNSRRFPRLAKLAKSLLCSPASEAPSERAFSLAGNVVSEKRSLLHPKNVDALLFIGRNFKLLQQLNSNPSLAKRGPAESQPYTPPVVQLDDGQEEDEEEAEDEEDYICLEEALLPQVEAIP